MSPADHAPRDAANLASVIQVGVLAADMWHLDNNPWTGTKAEYTRGLIETAIRHVVEQRLLRLTDDVEARFADPQGIPVRRSTGGGGEQ